MPCVDKRNRPSSAAEQSPAITLEIMTTQQPSTSGTGPSTEEGSRKSDLSVAKAVSYTHLTLPTTPYV